MELGISCFPSSLGVVEFAEPWLKVHGVQVSERTHRLQVGFLLAPGLILLEVKTQVLDRRWFWAHIPRVDLSSFTAVGELTLKSAVIANANHIYVTTYAILWYKKMINPLGAWGMKQLCTDRSKVQLQPP